MKSRDEAKSEASLLAKEGKDACTAWNRYKKLRNRVSNRLKSEERAFKHRKIMEVAEDPKKSWQTAKGFMNWKEGAGSPSQLNIKGNLEFKASVIASELNQFFIEKVKAIKEKIDFIPNSLQHCHQKMSGKYCKLWLNHVTVLKITKLIKNLKNSKSTGVDGLDSYSIRISAEIIAQPLYHIITLCLMQCKFPADWKYSKIIPLHKKDSQLEKENYRPVSILSPLSKILERIMFDQLNDYFTKNRLFNENLHGFRSHRSTQIALASMYDRWVQASSEMSDTIDHYRYKFLLSLSIGIFL